MTNPKVQIRPFKTGDEVWLPVAEVLKHDPDFKPSHRGVVVGGKLAGRVEDDIAPGVPRTWYVDVYGLEDAAGIQRSIEISSRKFRRHTKILIVRIGDWTTEQQALNPLASSLKAQLSLLLPPSAVDVEYIRTLEELAGAFRAHGGGLSSSGRIRPKLPWGYAILVGHGRINPYPGLLFGDRWCKPGAIANAIKGLGPGRRTFC